MIILGLFCLACSLFIKTLCSVRTVYNRESIAFFLLIELFLLLLIIFLGRNGALRLNRRTVGSVCLMLIGVGNGLILCLFFLGLGGLASLNYRSYHRSLLIFLGFLILRSYGSLIRLRILLGLSCRTDLTALFLVIIVCSKKCSSFGNSGINPLAVLGLFLALERFYLAAINSFLSLSLIRRFSCKYCLNILLGYVVLGLHGLGSKHDSLLSVLTAFNLVLVVTQKRCSLFDTGIYPLLALGLFCYLFISRLFLDSSLFRFCLCLGLFTLGFLNLCVSGSLGLFFLALSLFISLGKSFFLILKVSRKKGLFFFLTFFSYRFLLKTAHSSVRLVNRKHFLLFGNREKLCGRHGLGKTDVCHSTCNVCGRGDDRGINCRGCRFRLFYADYVNSIGRSRFFRLFLALFSLLCGLLFLSTVLVFLTQRGLFKLLFGFSLLFGFLAGNRIRFNGRYHGLCNARYLRLCNGRYHGLCNRSYRCGRDCGGGRIRVYFALGKNRWRTSSCKTCFISSYKL